MPWRILPLRVRRRRNIVLQLTLTMNQHCSRVRNNIFSMQWAAQRKLKLVSPWITEAWPKAKCIRSIDRTRSLELAVKWIFGLKVFVWARKQTLKFIESLKRFSRGQTWTQIYAINVKKIRDMSVNNDIRETELALRSIMTFYETMRRAVVMSLRSTQILWWLQSSSLRRFHTIGSYVITIRSFGFQFFVCRIYVCLKTKNSLPDT